MRLLVSPFFKWLPITIPLSLETQAHTNKIIYPLVWLETSLLLTREKKKKESSSFLDIHPFYYLPLVTPVRGDRTQLQQSVFFSFLFCSWKEIHSRSQWLVLMTALATDNTLIYLSFWGEMLTQMELMMNETSLVSDVFLISRTNNTDMWNEYRQQKEGYLMDEKQQRSILLSLHWASNTPLNGESFKQESNKQPTLPPAE